jgi:FkbM family methyltransferase
MVEVLRPGDLVIDIGANIGWHSLLAAAAVGETGRVLAFEPEPVTYRLLEASAQANDFFWMEAYPTAIGAWRATLPLGRPWYAGNAQHSFLVEPDKSDAVSVDIVPLDDMAALIDRPIRFLKMDIEGFEGQAFTGMRQILASPLAPETMLVEFSPLLLQKAGDTAAAFETVMAEFGYRAEIIHRFNTDDVFETDSLTELFNRTLASGPNEGGQYDLLLHRSPGSR